MFLFLRHATGLFTVGKTLTDRHASAAIRRKLIVADWSLIVVRDRAQSSLALEPKQCPRGGGAEGWDGMEGGRLLTDRRESVSVWGHDNRRGAGTATLALWLAERHWRDDDSCSKTEEKLYVWRARLWCLERENEREKKKTVQDCVSECVCNRRSGDRI